MKLSVIIPVFNANKYIENCVESVVGLSSCFKFHGEPILTEIILVDDGSNDGSADTCDRIAAEITECEVKVIHQRNRGVSVARNVGIENSSGDWLWFVDADDEINPTEECYSIPDNVLFTLVGFVWNENGQKKEYSSTANEIPYNLWRCWFRREIVEKNKIRFVEGRKYAEDQEFVWKYLLVTKCEDDFKKYVFAIPSPMYIYYLREGSAMTRKGVRWKKVKDIITVIFTFFIDAVRKCQINRSWVLAELRRMTKTMFVLLKRG